MTTNTKTDTCARCGATITLKPISKTSEDYRWYASDRYDSWHCGNDPAFPVRAHAPAIAHEPDLPHDFESPRGGPEGGLERCAVCGRIRGALIHD